ncbi:MAG: hypothetical protein K0Q43_189 [Ramlibacter sp.]|nr:hypothetical protein [Ramlibacter sp.]
MHATVYRFFQRGVKLPRPLNGVSGHLVLVPWEGGNGRRSLHAKLVDEKSETLALLPELHDAAVERITANGIKIIGSEVIARRTNNKSSADHYRQIWWCLVHTLYIGTTLDMIELDDHFQPVIPGFPKEREE